MTRFLFTILSLSSVLAVITNANASSITTRTNDGIVEIEKQKLVKFPDDSTAAADEQQRRETPAETKAKQDEAQRILEEIEKINQSLGYKKKQAEPTKLPPILDSSQYLFPKPAYQPFHAQRHQISGSNGEVLLVPSIRAVKFDRSYKRENNAQLINYNVPPVKRHKATDALKKHTPASTAASSIPTNQAKKSNKPTKSQYYFHPNQVHVPAPQTNNEQQQLPTHFVIPVRLYKLNKDEYVQKFSPQEYRVKGYKIVGDIDNFYGKAKHKTQHKKNSTPKYHLFFLPRELALNGDSTIKYDESVEGEKQQQANSNANNGLDMGSREEKLANRPFKLQTSATTGNNGTTSSTQIVRKRIVPKPLRNKETNINSLATQQLADGSSATSVTTVHITPPSPVAASASSATTQQSSNNINSGIINVPPTLNSNKNSFSLLGGVNRPSLSAFLSNSLRPNGNSNNNNNVASDPQQQQQQQQLANNDNANNATTNAIKLAFQNFFKLPFRQQQQQQQQQNAKPADASSATNLESVPLQIPQKTFFNGQTMLPMPFYHSEPVQVPLTPHQISSASSTAHQSNNNYNNNNYNNNDYKWDNDDDGQSSSSNSAADDDNYSQEPLETEKQIFGHRHKQQQATQKEAIKQGGIIIQRLKVRKGGIAIAGPGGVATAGSGGTAIVGPGGYALTHPRSLTIAGPGAKVIAIPADVDLKDALQRTNLDEQSFPREGKVVATGPTVYYSPATGTANDEEEQI